MIAIALQQYSKVQVSVSVSALEVVTEQHWIWCTYRCQKQTHNNMWLLDMEATIATNSKDPNKAIKINQPSNLWLGQDHNQAVCLTQDFQVFSLTWHLIHPMTTIVGWAWEAEFWNCLIFLSFSCNKPYNYILTIHRIQRQSHILTPNIGPSITECMVEMQQLWNLYWKPVINEAVCSVHYDDSMPRLSRLAWTMVLSTPLFLSDATWYDIIQYHHLTTTPQYESYAVPPWLTYLSCLRLANKYALKDYHNSSHIN